jgi:hypothetical protein
VARAHAKTEIVHGVPWQTHHPNVAVTARISFRGLMKERRRCAHCGTTEFGLVRRTWYRHQFCRKKCREQFLDKLAKDKEQFFKWLAPKPI